MERVRGRGTGTDGGTDGGMRDEGKEGRRAEGGSERASKGGRHRRRGGRRGERASERGSEGGKEGGRKGGRGEGGRGSRPLPSPANYHRQLRRPQPHSPQRSPLPTPATANPQISSQSPPLLPQPLARQRSSDSDCPRLAACDATCPSVHAGAHHASGLRRRTLRSVRAHARDIGEGGNPSAPGQSCARDVALYSLEGQRLLTIVVSSCQRSEVAVLTLSCVEGMPTREVVPESGKP